VSTLSKDRTVRRAGVVGSRRRFGEVRRIGKYPVLDPARVWCSLGTMLEVHDLVAVADRAVTSSPRLAAVTEPEELRRAAASARRGNKALRAALDEMRIGSWSRTESLLRIAVIRAGLPEPVLNREVLIARNRVAAPDLAWPELLVCAEYDGHWHDDRARRTLDLERHELLADAGWLVVRLHSRDLFPDPSVAVSRILRRLHERGYRHPGTLHSAVPAGWRP
jgi:very-short-patch-repair endonuclease